MASAGLNLRRSLAWLTGQLEVDRSKLEARLVGETLTTPAVTKLAWTDDDRMLSARIPEW